MLLTKCKLLYLNCESEPVELDGNILEVVEETEYLGTKVEDSGSSKKDMINRIKECKGVLNEIVEVLKLPGLSTIRLQYSEMLLGSCFKMKFKHGCEVWDFFNEGSRSLVNKLIPDTIKRILELPRSTPTLAIQYEFGVIDLDLEVEMERIWG